MFKGILCQSSTVYKSLDVNSGRCRIDDLTWQSMSSRGINISWILHIHVSYVHSTIKFDSEEYLVTAWSDNLHGIKNNVNNVRINKNSVFNDICDDSLGILETSLGSTASNYSNGLDYYPTMIFDNSVCIRGNGGPKLPSFTDITIKVIC